jgi:hypothetical protein
MAPAGVTAGAALDIKINFSWIASTANVGVTGYQVARCPGAGCSNFAQMATSSTTAFMPFIPEIKK